MVSQLTHHVCRELQLIEECPHACTHMHANTLCLFGWCGLHIPSQTDVGGQQVAHGDHACHQHHGEPQPGRSNSRYIGQVPEMCNKNTFNEKSRSLMYTCIHSHRIILLVFHTYENYFSILILCLLPNENEIKWFNFAALFTLQYLNWSCTCEFPCVCVISYTPWNITTWSKAKKKGFNWLDVFLSLTCAVATTLHCVMTKLQELLKYAYIFSCSNVNWKKIWKIWINLQSKSEAEWSYCNKTTQCSCNMVAFVKHWYI